MIKSIFIVSTTCVLLAVSVISYSRPFAPTQAPSKQTQLQNPANPESSALVADSSSKQAESLRGDAASEAGAGNLAAVGKGRIASEDNEKTASQALRLPETYVATAYSLHGRTASGQFVARGLIAADPRVLPLGTRVRLEAGPMSGEYLVADTGGAVKGRHVDIWIPTAREAMRFGKRAVKLTVLSYGTRKLRSTKSRMEARGKRI